MHDVKIKNLSFYYKNSDRLVLKDITIDIKSGEFVCLLGQSGCGKSTFLRLLAGLEAPTAGEILLDNKPICGANLNRGLVFQDYGLFPWMTAGENIMLALRQRYPNESKRKLKQLALDTLNLVGLDESIYYKLPKELSGGMQQRCAIAQVLSINPPILLMDEPFGALDAITRARLQDLLFDLWSQEDEKKTVFFVTHDVDEALLLASRIIVFGQSPSTIIYDYTFSSEKRRKREDLFEKPEILKLRNDLISQIHKDVVARID
ncbi:ABC transporter ATP-binding protein [Tepidimicrobium xylanilyticum]|uniref:NitT/TauT family transport system ATP-binding protein n=1 Tax=Tepidimicrobium xylanilyticum TaxID=1123352 RepID=A0A1H2ZQB6_9FIRM|nr:ABC transporter ATP-binding protein [Tepidimicrobium xylanilyticum]GMG96559.1 bacitracin ABC transporter ATP-binding protein [Tepidimicrobium xylanilyticum]SDX19586.1 NitT/TauT family transport system ATP-binding protein [Tepidimicrobium xylanilyticum]